MIFFEKNLRISKKSSTFAPAFEKSNIINELPQLSRLEHLTVNQGVLGSSPRGSAKRKSSTYAGRRCFLFCAVR